MRNQYKVLQEQYETIEESTLIKKREYLLKRLLKLSYPEKKEEFLQELEKNKKLIFYPNPYGYVVFMREEIPALINQVLKVNQPVPVSGIKSSRTIADRFHYVIEMFLRTQPVFQITRREIPYSQKMAPFDEAFYSWCEKYEAHKEMLRAIQAAQTQHTATHGVDLSNL